MATDGYFGIQILPNSISAEDPVVGRGGGYPLHSPPLSPTVPHHFSKLSVKIEVSRFVTAF